MPRSGRVSPTAYASHYERLRERMRGQGAPGAAPSVLGLGLGTLLEEGLPAWLQAIASVLERVPDAVTRAGAPEAPAERDPALPVPQTARSPVPPSRQSEIAMLLANLVLSRQPALQKPQLLDQGGVRC